MMTKDQQKDELKNITGFSQKKKHKRPINIRKRFLISQTTLDQPATTETQNKTTVRCHFTPTKLAKIKKPGNAKIVLNAVLGSNLV